MVAMSLRNGKSKNIEYFKITLESDAEKHQSDAEKLVFCVWFNDNGILQTILFSGEKNNG